MLLDLGDPAASHGFDAREIGLIRRISPHVAEGLRRACTASELGAGSLSCAGNAAALAVLRRAGARLTASAGHPDTAAL